MGLFDNLFAPEMSMGVAPEENTQPTTGIQETAIPVAPILTEAVQLPVVTPYTPTEVVKPVANHTFSSEAPTFNLNAIDAAHAQREKGMFDKVAVPTSENPISTEINTTQAIPTIPESPIVVPENPGWAQPAIAAVTHDTIPVIQPTPAILPMESYVAPESPVMNATADLSIPTLRIDNPSAVESNMPTYEVLQETVKKQAETIKIQAEELAATRQLTQEAKDKIATILASLVKPSSEVKLLPDEPTPFDMNIKLPSQVIDTSNPSLINPPPTKTEPTPFISDMTSNLPASTVDFSNPSAVTQSDQPAIPPSFPPTTQAA